MWKSCMKVYIKELYKYNETTGCKAIARLGVETRKFSHSTLLVRKTTLSYARVNLPHSNLILRNHE